MLPSATSELLKEVDGPDYKVGGLVANKQDFTISVAAIHHLSTPVRRRQAVQVSLLSNSPYVRLPFHSIFSHLINSHVTLSGEKRER
jgi:hypothetical protein